MKYRVFESGNRYCVAVHDGGKWMTFTFDDWESQNAFIVALQNVSGKMEEA